MLTLTFKRITFPRILAVLFLLLILAPNCRQSTLVRSQSPNARNAYRPASPGNLSSYIRTVLKISAEKGPAAEQRLKIAQEQNPELARQAEESSAHPTDVEAGLRLAESYVKAGLYYPAYDVYQRVLAASEPRAEIELGLAGIWDKWQDYSLAQTHAEYALQINAQSDQAWNLLGRIQLHRGDYQGAANSFQKALALQQSDAVLFANAGYAYLALGRLDEAQACLEKALSLDGTIVEAHNHLGIVLARRGEYDLALTHFNQTSEPAVALNNLGAVCLEQGRLKEARKFLAEALSVKPDYENALAQLREVDALAPPSARVNITPSGIHPAEPQPADEAGPAEAGPPPSRVSVSIAPAFSPALPKPAVSLMREAAKPQAEELLEAGKILLGKDPYVIEGPVQDSTPARLIRSGNHLYHPTLPARLSSVADRVFESLPPQAPGRYPQPAAAAPAPGRSGANLSVTALRWQEPLLNPNSPARALDCSTSPHSDQPSLFYVPSLVDVLFTWFVAVGLFLGLLLAGGAGAMISMAAVLLAIVGRLAQ